MKDADAKKILEMIKAMRKGDFRADAAVGDKKTRAEITRALSLLGATLERKFEEIKKIREITEKINAGFVLEDVLDYAYDSFRSVIPYDRIGFSLLDAQSKRVTARWARSEAPVIKIDKGYSVPLKGSSLQQVMETGKPRILNDLKVYLQEHPRSVSTRDILEEGMRSSLTCPLVARGKPIGFVFFSSMKPDTYRDAHVDIFLQIAGEFALIAEKSYLYERLLELNDLKNKFLGMAAHDLRNPIAVVQGYVQLLSDGLLGAVPDSQREALQIVKKHCRTMLVLIDDLLDVSAIESGELKINGQHIDFRDFLRDCCKYNEMLAKTKLIRLNVEAAQDLPKIVIDPDKINQVLNNLISNAVKFSKSHTTVTVKAWLEGKELRITVADQGQGIPAEELSHMFSFFGRTSVRPTAGEPSSGLGLAISKRIVEGHGGKIWAESERGVGSIFTFSLPLSGKIQKNQTTLPAE